MSTGRQPFTNEGGRDNNNNNSSSRPPRRTETLTITPMIIQRTQDDESPHQYVGIHVHFQTQEDTTAIQPWMTTTVVHPHYHARISLSHRSWKNTPAGLQIRFNHHPDDMDDDNPLNHRNFAFFLHSLLHHKLVLAPLLSLHNPRLHRFVRSSSSIASSSSNHNMTTATTSNHYSLLLLPSSEAVAATFSVEGLRSQPMFECTVPQLWTDMSQQLLGMAPNSWTVPQQPSLPRGMELEIHPFKGWKQSVQYSFFVKLQKNTQQQHLLQLSLKDLLNSNPHIQSLFHPLSESTQLVIRSGIRSRTVNNNNNSISTILQPVSPDSMCGRPLHFQNDTTAVVVDLTHSLRRQTSDTTTTNIIDLPCIQWNIITDDNDSSSYPSVPQSSFAGSTLDAHVYRNTGRSQRNSHGHMVVHVVSSAPMDCPVRVQVTQSILSHVLEPQFQTLRVRSSNNNSTMSWEQVHGTVVVVQNNQMDLQYSHILFPSMGGDNDDDNAPSFLTLSYDYRLAFPRMQEYPGDPNRGFEFPPVQAVFEPLCTTKDIPGKESSSSAYSSFTLYSDAMVILPPVPDMSMPFNVLAFVCGIYLFVVGNMINLAIRRSSDAIKYQYDPSSKPPNKLHLLRDKIKKKLGFLKASTEDDTENGTKNPVEEEAPSLEKKKVE